MNRDFESLRHYIMESLSSQKKDQDKLSKKLESFEAEFQKHMLKLYTEIATLKVKSGIWGLIGGGIAVIAGILIELMGRAAR